MLALAADDARRPRRLPAFLLLPLLLVLNACAGEPDGGSPGAGRLRRMLEAERTLAYQGTKEIEYFGERSRFEWQFVDHDPDGPTWIETMGEPTGRHRRWRERAGRFSWLRDIDLLERNYEVRERGRQEVMGRAATVLEVLARRPSRPSVELVVDDETGLLLGSEFRDHRGSPSFRSRFRTLVPAPARTAGRASAEEPEPPVRAPDTSVALAYRPRHLPEGFEEVTTWRWGPGQQTIYSDGLSWFTLTQRPAAAEAEERVVRQKVVSTRVEMTVVLGRVEIVLVGWIPAEELLPVLQSLEEIPEQRFSTDPAGGTVYNPGRADSA